MIKFRIDITHESKANKFLYKILFILGTIVIIGNLGDMVTTYFALHVPHTYEANPYMAHIIGNFGWIPFIFIKGLFCFFFFPIRFSPLYWVVGFSLKQGNFVRQFNVGIIIASFILSCFWFWNLTITNFLFLI